MFFADEILDFAVQIEQNGERLCRRAARVQIDAEIAALLEWMADQELRHIEWFLELRSRIRLRATDPQLAEFGRTLLSGVLGDQSFSLQHADFSKLENVKQLLSLLIEFEQDTVLFYQMLQAAVEDEKAFSLLEKIIAEETGHIASLREHFGKIAGRKTARR